MSQAASPESRASRPNSRVRIVAGAEGVGGIILAALSIAVALRGDQASLTFLFSESAATLAIVAGYWLWRGDSRGLKTSCVVLIAQIAKFRVGGVTYAFEAGPVLDVFLAGAKVGIRPALMGSLVVGPARTTEWFVAINVYALFALYWVLMYYDSQVTHAPSPGAAAPDHGGAAS